MGLQVEDHLAGNQLVHVQEVVDQQAQALTVLLGDLEHRGHACRHRAEGATVDQAEGATDGGQRSAQFVADGGDEVALQLLDALVLGDVVEDGYSTDLAAIDGVQGVGIHRDKAYRLPGQHDAVFLVADVLAGQGAQQGSLLGADGELGVGIAQQVALGPVGWHLVGQRLGDAIPASGGVVEHGQLAVRVANQYGLAEVCQQAAVDLLLVAQFQLLGLARADVVDETMPEYAAVGLALWAGASFDPDQAPVRVHDAVLDVPKTELGSRFVDGCANGIQVVRVQHGKSDIGIFPHLFRRDPVDGADAGTGVGEAAAAVGAQEILVDHSRQLGGQMLQAQLDLFALQKVTGNEQIAEQFARLRTDGRDAEHDRYLAAVAASVMPFELFALVQAGLGHQRLEQFYVGWQAELPGALLEFVEMMQAVVNGLAVEGLRRIIKQLSGGLVDAENPPLAVGGEHGYASITDDRLLQGREARLFGGAAAQLQLPHHLPTQACQGLALGGTEVMGALVDNAQGAEGIAVGRDQWGAGIEADVGCLGDQRVAAKARVVEGIGHFENVLLMNGVGAEGYFPRGFLGIQADPALEPLAAGVDQ